jgi:multidrug transporter EmrE-like cation transporter
VNEPTRATLTGFLYLFGTIALTVYGQLVIKWKVAEAGALPETLFDGVRYIGRLLLNPWVMSSLIAAFLAFVCWVATMTKFELTFAYPFMSLAFVLVLVFGALLLGETVNAQKIIGLLLITCGIVVSSRG